jgi:dimethylargininase
MDGGDVLKIRKKIFVGMTPRTNLAGIDQLRVIVTPYGYSVKGVPVHGCLHLKSAVTQVAENVLLVNPTWVDKGEFGEVEFIEVDPDEPFGANALLVNGKVIYPSAFPKTRYQLEKHGIELKIVDVSELGKAEGGVTCCSLIFESLMV